MCIRDSYITVLLYYRITILPVSYTHLRAHETRHDLVCRLLLEKPLPLAIVSGGKVFRKDDDATHLPMFHQVEGMCVGQNITFAHLKGLIFEIISEIFGDNVKVRFRPSYFPFTEPSAEVDILSDEGKWLEILGCGVINPVVLDNCNIAVSYTHLTLPTKA